MTDDRREDRALYESVMSEIRHRLAEAKALLLAPQIRRWDVDHAALQLRTAIELVVMSSLVANKDAVAAIHPEFATSGNRVVRQKVKQANPRYWPRPLEHESRVDDVLTLKPKEIFLAEDEWYEEWCWLSSEFLHAHNPFGLKRPDRDRKAEMSASLLRAQEILVKLMRLLEFHMVQFADSADWWIYRETPDPADESKIFVSMSLAKIDPPTD